jgi:hypothetical protein
VLYILSSTGTQDTNLGDRFLYNAAISYRLTGSASEKNGHSHSMKLGADFPEPMYHGGPKSSATHSHEEHAASPAPALDLVRLNSTRRPAALGCKQRAERKHRAIAEAAQGRAKARPAREPGPDRDERSVGIGAATAL